jgi:carbon storage regulator
MLILSRKPGESIVIDGRIEVKIVRVEGDVVKVGILAPVDLPVHRQEVYEEIQRNNKQALTRPKGPLPRLPFGKAQRTPPPAAVGTSLPCGSPATHPASSKG